VSSRGVATGAYGCFVALQWSADEEARMSEKDLHSPDERFEVVTKGNTRELTAAQKNRQKPEDIRLKDETTAAPEDDDDDE